MEDSETKTTALEKVADLEDELALTHERIATLEYDVHIVTSNVITFLYGTPNQSYEAVLLLTPTGPVQRMEPLTNLQVAIKNNIDVFYFAVVMPMNIFFAEDGQMDKRVFLSTWKDIPAANEVQYTINNVNLSADAVSSKMQQNNVFTIAKRNVEGQDMLYQSLKLVNGIWILSELKMQPGNPTLILAVKTRAPDVSTGVNTAFDAILHS